MAEPEKGAGAGTQIMATTKEVGGKAVDVTKEAASDAYSGTKGAVSKVANEGVDMGGCWEFAIPEQTRKAVSESLEFLVKKSTQFKDSQTEEWSVGTFGCLKNVPLCCSICLCPCWGCCVSMRNLERMSGKPCEVVFLNTVVTSFFCLSPCYYATERGKFRAKYGLKGGPCIDCLMGWCSPFSVCADANELMVRDGYKIPQMTYEKLN